ncbi:MAG: hypothetical protein ABI591_02540 [Kofleriaceae bacterium]
MFFDLQFTQDKFFALLQDQIQRAIPLVTDEFDNPLGSGKLLIDHLNCTGVELFDTPSKTIKVHVPGGTANVSGTVLVVKIDIDATLVTRDAVIAAGNFGMPAITSVFGLWLKAEISASASAAGEIKLDVTPIELGSVIDVLTASQKAALLAKMPAVGQTIALPDVAGHAMAATNAGLTLNANTVMVRAELSTPNASSKAAWTSFFAGGVAALGGEWAINLPPDLLVEIVDDAITSSVDAMPTQDSTLEIVTQPNTSWGIVGPISKATLNAVDACPVFASDIEFDLNFGVSFGLSASGNIQITINVEWDLDDWDVFRCGLATVVLPGAALIAIGSAFGPVGAIIAVVITIVGFIVAIVKISDTAHGNLSDGVQGIDPGSMNLQTIENDSDHVKLRGEVALGSLLPGMKATAVVGSPMGLRISGTLAVPAHHDRSLAKVEQTGFDWGGGFSCSKNTWSPDQIDAKLTFGDPNHYTIQCAVDVLTNPAADYVIDAPGWPIPFGYLTVDAASTVTNGTAPACELLIHTNSGVRYAKLGHLAKEPAPPSPEQLVMDRVACFKQRLPGPKKWLEAHWLVDPGPDAVIHEINVWDVVTSKITVGKQVDVAIVDARGNVRVAGEAIADARGLAEFRLATGKGEHIAVSRATDAQALWVAGAAAQEAARFVPREVAVDVAVVGSGANARIAVATHDSVLVLGLDGKTFGRASIPGLKQMVVMGSHVAAHDGVRVVAMRATPAALASSKRAPASHAPAVPLSFGLAPTRSWIAGTEIGGLAVHGGTITATLHDGTSVSLDRHLNVVKRTPRVTKWFAEPWMKAPLRVGGLVARVEKGAAVVYRYRSTAVF